MEMLLIPQSWKWSRKFNMVEASQRRHLSSPLFPEHSFLPGCWWNSLIAIHNASVSHWDGKTATLKCTEPLKNWSVLTKDCFIRDVGRIIWHAEEGGAHWMWSPGVSSREQFAQFAPFWNCGVWGGVCRHLPTRSLTGYISFGLLQQSVLHGL